MSNAADTSETVLPFSPSGRNTLQNDDNLLDRAGQTILGLLDRAATVTEQNNQRARDEAGKLSHQLRAAEDRIRDLEANVRYYQDRAEHAEKWLYQISAEIEKAFFSSGDNRLRAAPSPRPDPQDYAPRRNQYPPR
jgi:chromosome segregation ATPase